MKPSFLVFFGHATKLMGSQFPDQRWNPFPPALEAQGSSHWTTKKFLETHLFKKPCKPPHNYSLLCRDYKEH